MGIDRDATRVKRLRRSVKWAAELHSQAEPGRRPLQAWMLTLTYREVGAWEPQHVASFIRRLRKWIVSHGYGLRYTWVAELQKRGAVHYHVLVWLPRHLACPKPDKQGWWPHGMTERARARRPVAYMTKYASKVDAAGGFPKGLRLHGSGGFSAGVQRDVRHWLGLPRWLSDQVGVGQRCRRLVGGGFALASTGEIVRSPWRYSWSLQDGGRARELFTYLNPVEATGPFSLLGAPELVRSEVAFS